MSINWTKWEIYWLAHSVDVDEEMENTLTDDE